MKTINKFLIAIIAIVLIYFIINPNKVNAALQSNGETPALKNINNWMIQVRQMQEQGGTLGRTDIINTDNLKSNATDLDIHLQKNTEYGAMAILSASAYGNPSKIGSGETTTGNETGIVIGGTEWVAACSKLTLVQNLKNIAGRYKNVYNFASKTINPLFVGEASTETAGWHGASAQYGPEYNLNENFHNHKNVIRGLNGSIFSYMMGYDAANYINPYYSRAAIVVGNDF